MRGWFIVAIVGTLPLAAQGQISSPPPVAGRASGTPLSEVFTPDSLFPKKTEPPASAGAPIVPIDVDESEIPLPPPKIWSGSADLGLNGAYGNSDLLNLRGSWNVRRKTETNALTSDFLYVFSQQNNVTKTSQALFNARDEILFAGSRWSGFSASQVEYDYFRTYRFRVGVYGGAGYRLVDQPNFTFKLRAGAGATRELGSDGVPSRTVPEFVFGYDFRVRIDDRSQFISILDYYPRISDPRQYRFRARAAYEFVIDPKLGLIYRIGVQDRYDSDPGNAFRNDITFFTTVGLKF